MTDETRIKKDKCTHNGGDNTTQDNYRLSNTNNSSAPGTVGSFCSDNSTRRATSKRHEHNVGHQ